MEIYEIAQREDSYYVTLKFGQREVMDRAGYDIEWLFRNTPTDTVRTLLKKALAEIGE